MAPVDHSGLVSEDQPQPNGTTASRRPNHSGLVSEDQPQRQRDGATDLSYLYGGAGDGTLQGGGGGEVFRCGGNGIDSLPGQAGNDVLNVASQGELQSGDLFDGGAGNDTLWLAKGIRLSAGVTVTNIEVIFYGQDRTAARERPRGGAFAEVPPSPYLGCLHLRQ